MKNTILNTIADLCAGFLDYDRINDEDLSQVDLQNAINNGDISIDEMVQHFRTTLESHFEVKPKKRYFMVVFQCNDISGTRFIKNHQGRIFTIKYLREIIGRNDFIITNIIEMTEQDWEQISKEE